MEAKTLLSLFQHGQCCSSAMRMSYNGEPFSLHQRLLAALRQELLIQNRSRSHLKSKDSFNSCFKVNPSLVLLVPDRILKFRSKRKKKFVSEYIFKNNKLKIDTMSNQWKHSLCFSEK